MRQMLLALLLFAATTGSLAQPGIEVTSPHHGDNWHRTTSHPVTWTSTAGGNVAIQLYRRVGEEEDFTLLISGSTPNDGSYLWQIPQDVPTGDSYHIRIVSLEVDTLDDWSDGFFTISLLPLITVTAPNGGENWLLGSTHAITWTDVISGSLRIDLFRDGSLDTTIASAAGNTGSFSWHIPSTLAPGSSLTIRIRGVSDSTAEDFSDSTFTLSLPAALHLLSPNGGETWIVGDADTIVWTSVNLAEDVRIDLKRNYPGSSWVTLATSAPNTGSYCWTVSGPATTTARVRVSGITHTAVSDTSDANFTIADVLAAPCVVIFDDAGQERLAWNPVGGARYYQVWDCSLVNGAYDLLTTTADTTIAVNTSMRWRRFYYVSALH